MLNIVRAETDDHFKHARLLIEKYAATLDVDLGFQHFEEELSSLSAQYSSPDGCLLLAYYGADLAGCVALRKLGPDICEMKRLYVEPQFRSLKIGRVLAERIIEEGRRLRYGHMRLDTLPTMLKAQAMYRALGFREIPPYRFNPVEGTVFMELQLRNEHQQHSSK